MLITLSRHTVICQSVAEVQLTGVAPMGAVSHRFKFKQCSIRDFHGSMDKIIEGGGGVDQEWMDQIRGCGDFLWGYASPLHTAYRCLSQHVIIHWQMLIYVVSVKIENLDVMKVKLDLTDMSHKGQVP